MRNRLAAAGLIAVSAAALTTSPSLASQNGTSGPLTLAVFGDAPYGTSPTDDSELQATPAFIDSINADPSVRAVVHVGDIHSGKQYCTEAYDRTIFAQWTRFADPLVYTPGDNEWADCHKPAEGGTFGTDGPDYARGNPAANLDLVRSIFFATPGATLGSGTLPVLSQAQAYDPQHPEDAAYVENVVWAQHDVVFVTVNVPGGSNNDADLWFKAQGATDESPEQAADRTNRAAADIRWIGAAFAAARQAHAKGIVIITQADMWDLDGKTPAHLTNYEPLVSAIATDTTAFGRPVLLFNGDSHAYRSDNPLVEGAPCVGDNNGCAYDDWNSHPSYDVPNFHRVVVHGSTFPLEWLKLTVDPNGNLPTTGTTFGPFSWQRMIQS